MAASCDTVIFYGPDNRANTTTLTGERIGPKHRYYRLNANRLTASFDTLYTLGFRQLQFLVHSHRRNMARRHAHRERLVRPRRHKRRLIRPCHEGWRLRTLGFGSPRGYGYNGDALCFGDWDVIAGMRNSLLFYKRNSSVSVLASLTGGNDTDPDFGPDFGPGWKIIV